MIALNCNHIVHLAKRIVPAVVVRGSVVSTSPALYQAVTARPRHS